MVVVNGTTFWKITSYACLMEIPFDHKDTYYRVLFMELE